MNFCRRNAPSNEPAFTARGYIGFEKICNLAPPSLGADRIKPFFQLGAKLVAICIVQLAWNVQRFAVFDIATGKRQRQLKPVPTLETVLSLRGTPQRDDRQPGHLRKRQDAVLNFIARPAWAVRCNGQMQAGFHLPRQLQQRLPPAPASRSTYRLNIERPQNLHEERPIFTRAHHRGQVAAADRLDTVPVRVHRVG